MRRCGYPEKAAVQGRGHDQKEEGPPQEGRLQADLCAPLIQPWALEADPDRPAHLLSHWRVRREGQWSREPFCPLAASPGLPALRAPVTLLPLPLCAQWGQHSLLCLVSDLFLGPEKSQVKSL